MFGLKCEIKLIDVKINNFRNSIKYKEINV